MNRITIAAVVAVALGTAGYLLVVFFALTDKIISAWWAIAFMAVIFVIVVVADMLTEDTPEDEQ